MNPYQAEINHLNHMIAKLENDIATAMDYVASKRRLITTARATLREAEHQAGLLDPAVAEAAGVLAAPPADRVYTRYDADKIAGTITTFVRARGGAAFRIDELLHRLVDVGAVPFRKPTSSLRTYIYKRHLVPGGYTTGRGSAALWTPPGITK